MNALEVEAEAIRLDDEQLIAAIWETAIPLNMDGDDDRAHEQLDRLYVLMQEAFERWAPDAEWRHEQQRIRQAERPGLVSLALLDGFESRRDRHAARVLLGR